MRAPVGFSGIAIGLTLIHPIGIPVTNTLVNPVRSTTVALIQDDWAVHPLSFFWVMPIIGGIVGGMVYRYL